MGLINLSDGQTISICFLEAQGELPLDKSSKKYTMKLYTAGFHQTTYWRLHAGLFLIYYSAAVSLNQSSTIQKLEVKHS